MLAEAPECEVVVVQCCLDDAELVDPGRQSEGEVQAGGHASDVGRVDGGVQGREQVIATCPVERTDSAHVSIQVATRR